MSYLMDYIGYPSGVLPGNSAFVNEDVFEQSRGNSSCTTNIFFYPPKTGNKDEPKQVLHDS